MEHPPKRNLIICCDGTNNEFGTENTNVVRLAQVLERDSGTQLLYYDPGVGTLPEPGTLTGLGRRLSQWAGLALGFGLERNVEEAYSFLMENWKQGDQVFLFGFSRGAYTARVVAALLHAVGLLPPGNQNLVPHLLRLLQAIQHQRRGGGLSSYEKLCDEFRDTFARRLTDGDAERRFPVHFLGVWDTVSSVGWVWEPIHYPYTTNNESVEIARHAVSIDERRWFFRQNLLGEDVEGQNLQQLWFSGVHSDVGGGYPKADGGLWRVAFQWMLGEAITAGLRVNQTRLDEVLKDPPAQPWAEPQHESLTWAWWPAEFFPKWRRKLSRGDARVIRFGLGRHRSLPENACLHDSVLQRLAAPSVPMWPPSVRSPKPGLPRRAPYDPPNLQKGRFPGDPRT